MKLLIVVIIVVGIIATLVAAVKAKKGGGLGTAPWPFYAKKVLSSPEQVLYLRLVKALPDYLVLAQVGLSRILGVKKGNNRTEWFNRISRMSADFVICTKDSAVIAIIELDDASHEKPSSQAADARKDKALVSAGIRVLRWNVKSIPDEATIRTTFVTPQEQAPLSTAIKA